MVVWWTLSSRINALKERHNTTGMKAPKPVPHHDTNPKAKPKPNHQHVDQVQSKPSFASIIHNKPASHITKTVSLKDHDLIRVNDSSTVLLLKIKDVDTMSNMPMICKNKENNDNDKVQENSVVYLNDLNDNLNKLVQELNEEEVKATKLSDEDQVIVEEEGNFNFNYACILARGRSGGLISMWYTNMFTKERIWCDEAYIIVKGQWSNAVGDCFMINIYAPQESTAKSTLWNKLTDFMQHHNGRYILLGDCNVVRCENGRFGSIFSCLEADQFNAFIDSSGLLDLHIRGRLFTWMNKAGTKMSKLDRFLIFEDILEAIPDICITSLDKLWSDHTPILLHVSKSDFGPTPFKFYNSWLFRDGFDECIKAAWPSLEFNSDGRRLASHEKLRSLKHNIKQWHANTSSHDRSSKQSVMRDLKLIDKKINDGSASQIDLDNRIKLMQDLDNFDKFEALDLVQKTHIKWDIEGDENSNFFHGMINQKRRTQAIKGIMHDGEWITDPVRLKDVFLNFFKVKFQAHNSQVTFSHLLASNTLPDHDSISLEAPASISKIKDDVWACGSFKAPKPDGFSFTFDAPWFQYFFFTLIPKVSNPIFIKYFRPISLIGIHYKIIAKVLAIRISKVIDKIVSHEQSAFIAGRQLLDGPLILSEAIDWFKKRKKQMLLFKVDFEKAFDSSSNDLDNIIRVFYVFYLASGLKINMHKSNIYGVGVSNEDVSSMSRDSGCASGSFPLMFLGLPIGSNMSRINNWKPLIDRFHSRLSSWKANLLSIGGRLTLIKSVLGSLGIYYLSIFKAPELVLKDLERSRASFFWGSTIDNKKMAWIKWSNILPSFDKGGLNIGSLKSFNFALLQKRRWRMFHFPNSLWVKIIKAFHGSEGGFDSHGCSFNGTWSKFIGTYNRLYHLEQEKDCLIINRFDNGNWKWNWSRDDIGVRNSASLRDLIFDIEDVDLNMEEDSCMWALSSDSVFSVGDTRCLIDAKLLPSSTTPTSWDKVLSR
nr:RNA-directed DNA polymerase, eukaryota [Tanacetum cinerariifolium]